ncbi:hypothetical protein MANES_07G004300v8 [Manihot esculenta]|nr:hypothetical protein MANES_07G004300v8 [Manihot esculenta]
MSSQRLEKLYLEAKREAEDSWKEKEKNLLLLIGRLQFEKQEILEENRCLKLEKEKSLGELDEKTNFLFLRERSEQVRIDELEKEVRKQSKEFDKGMVLHDRLLQLLQRKSFMTLDKGKQLKEYEEMTNGLLATVKSLEKKVEVLEDELRRTTINVVEKKELAEVLLTRIAFLLSHLTDISQLSTEHEKEKKKLVEKLERFEEDVSELQRKLEKKTQELEYGRVLQAELLQQIVVNKLEILKQKQQLEESENRKKLLLEGVNALEEKINELNENIRGSNNFAEGKDSYEKLLQQTELKDSQLLAEKKICTEITWLVKMVRVVALLNQQAKEEQRCKILDGKMVDKSQCSPIPCH